MRAGRRPDNGLMRAGQWPDEGRTKEGRAGEGRAGEGRAEEGDHSPPFLRRVWITIFANKLEN